LPKLCIVSISSNNLKPELNTSQNFQQSIPPFNASHTLPCFLKPQHYSALFFIMEFISGILFQTKLKLNHFPNLNLLWNHRRGKWGCSCPSGDILALPGRLLPPLRLVSWAIFGTKKTLLIRRRYFFCFDSLENAWFWVKKTLQIRCRPFFRERLFLGQKTIQFQRRTLFRVPDFGAFGFAPLS